MTAAVATFRAFALDECRSKPSAIRDVAKAIAGAFDDGGALRGTVREADVYGKTGESNRQRDMRTEYFRAVAQVLLKLVAHMDVVTGDVGRAPDRTFIGLRVDTLSEALGMCQRRVERALWTLHRLGMLRTWTRAERQADTFRGHTAIRKISIEPILRLVGPGWLTRWATSQREEYERRRHRPPSPEAQARAELRRLRDDHLAQPTRQAAPRRRVEGFTQIGAAVARILKPPG